jgi:NADH:ubiquinone oxidoreductase subunit E
METNIDNIELIFNKHPNISRDTLIPIMQEIQDEMGYLGKDAVWKLSRRFGLPTSKIYGLATFYNQFRFKPRGKFHIQICNGSSCHLYASQKLISDLEKELQISDGETSRDQMFSLEVLPCIGACGQSPVMCINGEYYTRLDAKRLKEIIANCRETQTS